MSVVARWAVWFALLGSVAALPQEAAPAPVFDTVSVRPSDPSNPTFGYNPNPNSFQAKGVTLPFLIQLAYDVNPSDIVGMPPEFQEPKFDIRAKADVDPASAASTLRYSSDEGRKVFQARLQAVLLNRFQLHIHRAEADRPVLLLQVGNHVHLRPAVSQHPMQSFGLGYLKFDAEDMDGFAKALAGQLRTNVLNRTAIAGNYELAVKWDVQPNGEAPVYPFTVVSDALSDQLGLKLVRARASVPILVVDSAAQPTPN